MRLYLSSYRVGPHQSRLLELARGGRRTALIPNALDGLPATDREAGLRRDIQELEAAGLTVSVCDLRQPGVTESLGEFDVLWARGGNVFMLRRVLANTAADSAITELLAENAVVFGGYSAGPCVLAPDLGPLVDVDDIRCVEEPIMTGLGVLDRPFIPHVNSPGHPETEACTRVSAALRDSGCEHWALADGEVLIIDGEAMELAHP